MIGRGASRTWRKLGGRLARIAGRTGGTYDWQLWFRDAVRRRGVDAVLRSHENAAAMETGFNVGAYLLRNPDVADVVASPGEAVFHFLEFGHAEGRDGLPDYWLPSFVRLYHGRALPRTLNAAAANAQLRQSGVSVAEILLCEEHLWAVNGVFGRVFQQIFEHEFYAVAAELAGHALPSNDRLTAIRHFCGTGLEKGIPPHPDHGFDGAFYLQALELAGVEPPETTDAEALRRHWARVGVRAGAHANPRAWFSMRAGIVLPQSVIEALPAFKAASPDLASGSDLPSTLAHLAEVPMPGALSFDLATPGMEGFLLDLARHRRGSGDPGGAEWLLQRVLQHRPGHARAALDLADLIHGQNRIGTEIQLRQLVPKTFDSGANRITLAERLVVQNRLDEALAVCADLPETVSGDVALRRRRRDLGGAIFNTVWSDLANRIATTPVSDLQTILAGALALYTPPFSAPRRSAPIRRIAVLANDDLYQCKLYRADQKIDQLRAAGHDADLYLQSIGVAHLREHLHRYDAVIFMRVPAFLPIIDLIAEAAQQGLATFYDCDDLIFDPDLFPPSLSSYGKQITRTEHAAIACGVPLFRHAMSLCEYGIASTETIRSAMESVMRSGRVFLHRNALGMPHLRALERAADRPPQPRDRLVLFYGSGTKAHKQAFAEVLEPALARVMAQRPGKVELRIIGDFPELAHLDPRSPDVRLLAPTWDFEAFCEQVAEADINLSVLEPSVLTDAKSEIKWMEAAMFGIPSVVSPTATHREVIEEGETGLFATDADGFAEAILRLIDTPDLRARIGTAARERVLRDYGLPVMGANLRAAFDTVRPPDAAGKTRLLIVNVFYPPQDIGGATRVVQDNVADLMRLYGDHYDIDVLATLEGGEQPHQVRCYARDGVRIWTVTARDGIDTMEVQEHRMADVFDRMLTRIQPDIVHLHCIQRLTASVVDVLRWRTIPYVITLHDGWWVSPNQFIAGPDGTLETYDFNANRAAPLPTRAQITQRSLAGAAAVLAVSEPFARLHREAGLGAVEAVENGLSSLPARDIVPGKEGRVRLGHIGGASRHKGYTLLRAALHARRFSNLDLLIVDHAMPPGQSRRETWNGTPVLFVPRRPLDEVGTLYGQIDVLLAPSIWPESHGLVTREALALGLWVIASDRGAIGQDVVEGETGFVIDVSDHHALVACLAKIDAAPERYNSPPETRPHLRRSEDQARDLHDVYRRILAGVAEGD